MKPKFLSLFRFDTQIEWYDASTVENPDEKPIRGDTQIHMSFLAKGSFDTELDLNDPNLIHKIEDELCVAVEKALKLCEPNRCWVITDRKTGDQWVTTSKEEVKNLEEVKFLERGDLFFKPRYNIEKAYLKQ
ncbi:MAG: hypothetical protein ACLFUH_08040 [Bacteroidales bacterium]